jgi:UDPglucose--hexose-1-phosphate uridylyltransferase
LSEIRQDPTTKEWVIIASNRVKRPHDFVKKRQKRSLHPYEPSCPFCLGNEHLSPEEILRYPTEGSSSWRVRVVNNKYPALVPQGSTRLIEEVSFFTKMDGVGVHDVIIETPLHNRFIPLMEDQEVEELLTVYRERYNQLSRDPRVKLIIIFKNHGGGAGTSLIHPHSQLVATPVVSAELKRQFEVAMAHYNDTGRCLYQDIIDHELKVGERIVMDTEGFVVFHPFASRMPFETWIMPKKRQTSFGKIPTKDLASLAQVLRITLLKLYLSLHDPDFNYAIHTAPVGDENKDYYLWHIRIVPRLTSIAGFEIGSGMYINATFPEETADFIRNFKL